LLRLLRGASEALLGATWFLRGLRRHLSCFGERAAIYVIHTGDSGKSYRNRAGFAFLNKDGSFTFKLDILPQTKFQLREEQPFAKEVAAE